MRDKYFLAWGRDADENGPERDDTIGKIVSIESFSSNSKSSASMVTTSGRSARFCHRSTSWSFATPCSSKRSQPPRITTKRYVPTLRPRKLGSTGVEIRWSISGRLDLSGANLSLPAAAASRPVPASATR
jgi:hypothetical protein